MRNSIIVIPAKKSPKNGWVLDGWSLVQRAMNLCENLDFPVYVSTDDLWVPEITYATVHRRKPEVADTPNVLDPIVDLVQQFELDNPIVTIVQVTSPFTRVQDILSCWGHMQSGKYSCVQTIYPCPHNSHAFNHRELSGEFRDRNMRMRHPDKHSKTKTWLFGNVVSFSFADAQAQNTVFPQPTYGVEIEPLFAWDVDDHYSYEMAQHLLPLFKEKTK
tara:strand:+ start:104 stop:757 length:654 start_codon:yes stop_codon:yes gene_type:complete